MNLPFIDQVWNQNPNNQYPPGTPTECQSNPTALYPGILGGLIPASSGRAIAVTVPSGPDVTIQVFGVQSTIGCPSAADIISGAVNTQSNQIGDDVEVGRTVVDLFQSKHYGRRHL